MGARYGYSVLNGVCFLIICSTGLAAPFLSVFVLQAMSPIIVFVGLVIAADTFSITPPRHYTAVVLGMIPSLAEWATKTIATGVTTAINVHYQSEGLLNKTMSLEEMVG